MQTLRIQKRFVNRLDGFSLIELLVVIAIIGLLGSLIFIQLGKSRARGRDAQREQNMKTLQNALAIYTNTTAKYPPSNAGSLPYGPAALTGADPVSLDLINSEALPSIPADPINTGNYVYKYSSTDGMSYTIEYYLETDTIPGKPAANNPQTVTP